MSRHTVAVLLVPKQVRAAAVTIVSKLIYYCSIATVACIWYVDFLPPALFGVSCRCNFWNHHFKNSLFWKMPKTPPKIKTYNIHNQHPVTLAIFTCLHDACTASIPSAHRLRWAETYEQQDHQNGVEDVQTATAAAAAHKAAQAGPIVAFGAKEAKTWHLDWKKNDCVDVLMCRGIVGTGHSQGDHPKWKLEEILFFRNGACF